jgi:hypothetical protein
MVEGVIKHTIVDKLQFGDDVEPNVGEFVLQHLQEHRKEM